MLRQKISNPIYCWKVVFKAREKILWIRIPYKEFEQWISCEGIISSFDRLYKRIERYKSPKGYYYVRGDDQRWKRVSKSFYEGVAQKNIALSSSFSFEKKSNFKVHEGIKAESWKLDNDYCYIRMLRGGRPFRISGGLYNVLINEASHFEFDYWGGNPWKHLRYRYRGEPLVDPITKKPYKEVRDISSLKNLLSSFDEPVLNSDKNRLKKEKARLLKLEKLEQKSRDQRNAKRRLRYRFNMTKRKSKTG